jgi:hypothetical protein
MGAALLSLGVLLVTVGATGIGAGAGLLELPLVQLRADNMIQVRVGGRRMGGDLSTTTGSGTRL